jgi:hypothetical protein
VLSDCTPADSLVDTASEAFAAGIVVACIAVAFGTGWDSPAGSAVSGGGRHFAGAVRSYIELASGRRSVKDEY